MPPFERTHRLARNEATNQLESAGIESPALDARVLLAHVLEISQTELLTRDNDFLAPADLERYNQAIQQRSTGVPVAYLIGEREFMGILFKTAPGVLVPRPDTEPLVEWGLRWLHDHPQAMVVDIGTGSGAIAISMVAHADDEWSGHAIATDVSEDALEIAMSTADRVLAPDRRERLDFRLGSLTEPIREPVDLLLTNLPYLTPEQTASNSALRHEPSLALDGGDDGLDLVRAVIADLPRVLTPKGAVGFEIDPAQSAEVQQLLARSLPSHQVGVVHDLAGDERHVVAYLST